MKSIHKIGLWAIAMLLPWVATATPNEATDSVKSAVPMSRMTVSQSSTKPQGKEFCKVSDGISGNTAVS